MKRKRRIFKMDSVKGEVVSLLGDHIDISKVNTKALELDIREVKHNGNKEKEAEASKI